MVRKSKAIGKIIEPAELNALQAEGPPDGRGPMTEEPADPPEVAPTQGLNRRHQYDVRGEL